MASSPIAFSQEHDDFAGYERERVDNGDGTYTIALPEGLDLRVGDQAVDGFLTWQYDGQQVYRFEPEPRPTSVTLVGAPEVEESQRDILLRSVKIDRFGSRWRVADVDMAGWDEYVARYDAMHVEDVDPVGPGARDIIDESVPVGVSYEFEPNSWVNHGTCSNGATNRTWEGESRQSVWTGHTSQEKGAVRVEVTLPGGTGLCSGVLVEDSHVLTAAHCVTDGNGNAIDQDDITVCRDNFPACVSGTFSINDLYVPPSYNGNAGNFSNDWAIIKLGFPIVPAADTLALSSAPDSVILNLTRTRTFGYPSFVTVTSAPGCGWANINLRRNTEVESPASTTSGVVRFRTDQVGGQSGSPFYYCPAGDDSFCSPGDSGFVYAVHSGFNSFNMRVVGPKVSSFRSVALAFMSQHPQ